MPTGLISMSTAARILGISDRTIARRVAAGDLTKYTVGRLVRLDRAEVEALAVKAGADGCREVLHLEDHIAKALADAPPLTEEQRERIARLLVTDGAA